MYHAGSCDFGVNDARTSGKIDTRLTQGCSADVPAGLINLRTRHGYDSAIGHRCSNILEMLDAGARPADIAVQVAELASLHSKGHLG